MPDGNGGLGRPEHRHGQLFARIENHFDDRALSAVGQPELGGHVPAQHHSHALHQRQNAGQTAGFVVGQGAETSLVSSVQTLIVSVHRRRR